MSLANLPAAELANPVQQGKVVLGFYDLTCPFCYISQNKSSILSKAGLTVVELPFSAHPDVPAAGTMMGERRGPMYDNIVQEAKAAGLPLIWQPRLPNSRLALSATEWVRQHDKETAERYRRAVFNAHFAEKQAIDDVRVLTDLATKAGVRETSTFRKAIEDGSAERAVTESEKLARTHGVSGTPTWVAGGSSIVGNRSVAEFERFAASIMSKTSS